MPEGFVETNGSANPSAEVAESADGGEQDIACGEVMKGVEDREIELQFGTELGEGLEILRFSLGKEDQVKVFAAKDTM